MKAAFEILLIVVGTVVFAFFLRHQLESDKAQERDKRAVWCEMLCKDSGGCYTWWTGECGIGCRKHTAICGDRTQVEIP